MISRMPRWLATATTVALAGFLAMAAYAGCINPEQLKAAVSRLKQAEDAYSKEEQPSLTKFVRDLFKSVEVNSKSFDGLMGDATVKNLSDALDKESGEMEGVKKDWDKRTCPAKTDSDKERKSHFSKIQSWGDFGELVIIVSDENVGIVVPGQAPPGTGPWAGLPVPRVAYVGKREMPDMAAGFVVHETEPVSKIAPDPQKVVVYRYAK